MWRRKNALPLRLNRTLLNQLDNKSSAERRPQLSDKMLLPAGLKSNYKYENEIHKCSDTNDSVITFHVLHSKHIKIKQRHKQIKVV